LAKSWSNTLPKLVVAGSVSEWGTRPAAARPSGQRKMNRVEQAGVGVEKSGRMRNRLEPAGMGVEDQAGEDEVVPVAIIWASVSPE